MFPKDSLNKQTKKQVYIAIVALKEIKQRCKQYTLQAFFWQKGHIYWCSGLTLGVALRAVCHARD